MAQLVFVHGVNTRREPDEAGYELAVATRDRRFTDYAFEGTAVEISNIYWGDLGAHPAWDLACVPKSPGESEVLGSSSGDGYDPARSTRLVDAARENFAAVTGALSAESLTTARPDRLVAEETLWARAARFALDAPHPHWLDEVRTDEQFLQRLQAEIEPPQDYLALGIGEALRRAAGAVAGGASNLVNAPFARAGRDRVTPLMSRFIGDVFRYLKAGDAGAAIRSRVRNRIAEVAKTLHPHEPLILMGHSMGGVILYDLLSSPAEVAAIGEKAGRALEVDLLVTVGSQVALFEEIKVFDASDESVRAGQQVAGPKNVKAWWNVYDYMDVLSFKAEPVFVLAHDMAIDTTAGVKDAHGAYFESMVFYRRLNARLKTAGLIS